MKTGFTSFSYEMSTSGKENGEMQALTYPAKGEGEKERYEMDEVNNRT